MIFGGLIALATSIVGFLNNRVGAQAQTNLDSLKATLAAHGEANKEKRWANAWWGAKLIILAAGLPASFHMGAVFLDSTIPPFGSWGIPKLPPPYDGYERDIVLSFFIVLPAMPIAFGLAQGLANLFRK
jgi:hypothetical protein